MDNIKRKLTSSTIAPNLGSERLVVIAHGTISHDYQYHLPTTVRTTVDSIHFCCESAPDAGIAAVATHATSSGHLTGFFFNIGISVIYMYFNYIKRLQSISYCALQ